MTMRTTRLFLLLLLALSLCGSCTTEAERRQMERIVAEADSMNRNYVPMTTDSLLLQACRYYDRHGQPNERMRAHYLLGCAYRDMGEAPRAIDAYQDAAACADTLAEDCDFQKLGCVYSQMADVFHRQLLLTHEIEARRNATHFIYLAKDTLNAIYDFKITAGAYILLNKPDSAEIILKQAIAFYLSMNAQNEAVLTTMMLMHIYVNRPEHIDRMKLLIDQFETKCTSFNAQHELPSYMRQYYYYKGCYYENIGFLDSAAYNYRKIYHPNMSPVENNPMYKGLLSVYKKLHQADSIAKYAQLYCEANDSSISIKDQDLTARLAASYNYVNYQKLSLENAHKANYRLQLSIVLLAIAFIASIVAGFFRYRYITSQKEKREALEKIRESHNQAIRLYEEKLQRLRLLESNHQAVVETIRQELKRVQQENTTIKSDNADSLRLMEKLDNQYKEEKQQLIDELNAHVTKIEQLERQIHLSEYRQNTIPFMSMGIVHRIKIYAKDNQKRLSDNDLNVLLETTKEHFPDLISDLNEASGIGTLGVYVCILVLINLSPKEITHLLNLSSSHVANLKRDINIALFHDATATTLHKNLTSRYKVFSC